MLKSGIYQHRFSYMHDYYIIEHKKYTGEDILATRYYITNIDTGTMHTMRITREDYWILLNTHHATQTT